jgi:LuxR family transcriptional regulator, maltose regulon positive regulatory protein
MPRHTIYLLRWSEQQQRYEMTGGLTDAEIPQPTSPEWLNWLSAISSFAFVCRSETHYTARKEKLQRGGAYWYGYRSHLGKTIKRYIGKTTDLSIARLEEVATHLMRENLPSSNAQALHTQMSNGTAEIGALAVRHTPTLSSWEKETTTEPLTMQMMPLLISKLHPPHLPSTLVARPDLFARLDTGIAHKLTLLSTPAGFGKTTAISQWLTERNTHPISAEPPMAAEETPHLTNALYQQAAWVALDAGDNDPVRFWRYLIAACQSFHTDLGRGALTLLFSALQPPFELPSQEIMLTFLLNDITHYVSSGLLILDDYHIITEPRIHAMMTFFIDHLPASLHVILLTRSEPPLPLVRWRARGELHDIRTADLRFSPEETAMFLQLAVSPVQPATLSENVIVQLTRGMEGWAAGLRLLLLTLPGKTEQGELEHLTLLANSPERLNGYSSASPQRVVVEYLITEVLNAQPKPLQHFLLQTSILSRLTGSLCDTVTGGQDCATLLRVAERAGLFLEALEGAGQEGQWYRYHPFFAEAMHREALVRLGAERLRALAQSASHWYEQHDMLVEAVEATLSAQEFDRAAFLIERLCETGSFYEMQTLLLWVNQVPETVLMRHPELSFYGALALLFTQVENEADALKTARMNERLKMAEDGWRASGNYARLGEVFATRALTIWRGEISKAGAYARQALDLLAITLTHPHESTSMQTQLRMMEWRSICVAILGMEIMGEGDLDKARQMLQEARSNLSSNSTRAVTMILASILLMQGEFSHATAYMQQVLSEARTAQDWGDMTSALHGLMDIAYEWNDLTTMEHWAHEVEEMDKHLLNGERREMLHFSLALLQHLRGETKKAQQQLTALLARMELIQSPTVLPLLFDVQSWQIRLHLTLGDLPAAQRSLMALSHHKHLFSPLYHERWQVLQARLLLARGEAQAALLQLESLLAIVSAKQRTRETLEIQVQMALAYAACKRGQEARLLLRQILTQAQSENYLRLFLDEGESLVVLLRSLLPTLQEKWLHTYAQHILQIFHSMASETDPQVTPATLSIEPLSTQERRVLRLLIAGQTNPQMARELVVSVNTIKDHVKNLYRKLHVSNRLAASEVARRLKLS